ncbi:ribbon-helix-helix domain-containing protein [Vallitalea guaymasensis]|uniref:ribbon-helix-helix domain-containing protein n=1 Tax=Vallitalea guaymasensis TaxID=1185412 RepID=UPI00272C4426|nr:ribbon-helix-helix domain-containing protein [Vallitalea guaymasensis]
MSNKKMGRPTEKPMPIRVGFRLDKKTLDRLDQYCDKNNISRSELIRKAIIQLIDDN